MPHPPTFSVPEAELQFKATRAGGPGGQHVNTSSTRVEVRWNVRQTNALSGEEKARLLVKLASRIDAEGWLRVVAATTRSQLRNRDEATERLEALIARALVVPRARRPTKTPPAQRRQRLEAKRRRGKVKADRRRADHDD